MTDENRSELKERTLPYRVDDLAPADYVDPVIEAYKKDVDRTLLRENLKLSTDERSRKFERDMDLVWELRRVAAARRRSSRE